MLLLLSVALAVLSGLIGWRLVTSARTGVIRYGSYELRRSASALFWLVIIVEGLCFALATGVLIATTLPSYIYL
ncbi:MAG: hypothetical protein EON58_02420 [Alphaproteobacteria bacterium]|nr:MAG: hypothetical protein EON58_02420 [Alphaproteobacteria bacterium]